MTVIFDKLFLSSSIIGFIKTVIDTACEFN